MIEWVYVLSGTGMAAVGIGAMTYWYLKKRTNPVYYAFGAVLWAAAIALKLVMDFTISAAFSLQVTMIFAPLAALVVLGLYYGLRTGLFESGFTYFAVRHTRLSRSGFDEAVALGIGFGGAEALLLGGLVLVNGIALLTMPGVAAGLEPTLAGQNLLVTVLTPGVERLFTLFCHVFSTVLVVYAVRSGDIKWLGVSVLYKTLLDGSLPLFNHYLAGAGVYATLIIEAFVVAMGITGITGLLWLRKRFLEKTAGASRQS